MRIGYGRISTQDQSLDLQLDALHAAGCARVFTDKLSGRTRHRPGLDKALKSLRPHDTLIVWRLDRLGRSLADLIELVSGLQAKGCEFHSLTESIDTATSGGKLVFHLFGAIAEFERRLIVERTLAGLQAARSRGVILGRRPKMTRTDVETARTLLASGTPVKNVAAQYGVGRSTLFRHVAHHAAPAVTAPPHPHASP